MNKNFCTEPNWSLEDSMQWVADFKAALRISQLSGITSLPTSYLFCLVAKE